jgi:hypothetical protein
MAVAADVGKFNTTGSFVWQQNASTRRWCIKCLNGFNLVNDIRVESFFSCGIGCMNRGLHAHCMEKVDWEWRHLECAELGNLVFSVDNHPGLLDEPQAQDDVDRYIRASGKTRKLDGLPCVSNKEGETKIQP